MKTQALSARVVYAMLMRMRAMSCGAMMPRTSASETAATKRVVDARRARYERDAVLLAACANHVIGS